VAAQAESAASTELARLSQDLAEAVEQQKAASDVLEAIGRSAFELAPVFETVVRHAVRLCRADSGMIWRLEGDAYRLAASLGESPEYRHLLEGKRIARASGATSANEIGLVGLVGLERRTVLIADARTDPRYEWPEALELGGLRSMLGVPMLTDDEAIGVIVLNRRRVDPFDERTIRLVTTFAAQGAIAIEQVRLSRELERRGDELARSVDELQALGEISQAVSSTLDLDQVLAPGPTRRPAPSSASPARAPSAAGRARRSRAAAGWPPPRPPAARPCAGAGGRDGQAARRAGRRGCGSARRRPRPGAGRRARRRSRGSAPASRPARSARSPAVR
jgi:hypothetical protein